MREHEIFSRRAAGVAVKQLLGSGKKIYLACTGAGAGVTNLLWRVPGASSMLMGSAFPYAQKDFDLFVGRSWKNSGHSTCGYDAAVALAQAAYFRCQQICAEQGDASSAIGIGLTAAVATTRTLKGGTRCFAAVRTSEGIATCEIWMEQGFLGREGDGMVCDAVALNMALIAAELPQIPLKEGLRLTSDHLVGIGSGLILSPVPFRQDIMSQFDFSVPVLFMPDGQVRSIEKHDFSKTVVFPGAFNPLQFGHDAIARAVEEMTGKNVVFEITIDNVDKMTPSVDALVRRVRQFAWRWPVILRSGASLFVDKILDYEGVKFVVGADTALRILDAKYYGGVDELCLALDQFLVNRTRFYVSTRMSAAGLLTCESLPIPEGYRELFIPLPGRWDISSTAIREGRQ